MSTAAVPPNRPRDTPRRDDRRNDDSPDEQGSRRPSSRDNDRPDADRRDSGRSDDRRDSDVGDDDRRRDDRRDADRRDHDRHDTDRYDTDRYDHDRHDADGERRQPESRDLVAIQAGRFGGMKAGSAFFGWVTATGMTVILLALVTAIGSGIGFATNTSMKSAQDSATNNGTTATVVGAIVLGLIILIAYFCGGYVAGRMARFTGVRQGLAVWLWAALIAGIIVLAAVLGGSQFDLSRQVSGLPSLPVSGDTATLGSVIVLIAIAVLSLVGALLGGAAGMRFHRRIDMDTPELTRRDERA